MTLNQELIRSRCQDIEESLERLDKIKTKTREAFLADQDAKDITCYRLLVAIESALSLCCHISAKHLKKVPEDYAECFAIMAEGGIIPAELSENLQKMARFRNLLIHMYWKVDYGAVYEIMQNNLNDLRRFSEIVAALL